MLQEENGMDISIIIPLYKGQKYIERLMQMISANYLYMDMYRECKLEVIFVNDFPDQAIEIQEKIFSVKVYSNSSNQGIHQTRVNGIEQARGNYVIMFDQDDLIRDNYLYSQWSKIRESKADFCVCKGWSSRFRTIGNQKEYAVRINDLEHYFTMGNPIMSPGQVIIRRESIPEEWKENILNKNGADDCFLWTLILLHKGRFVVNEDFLYYHTPERTSDSISSNAMTDSLIEMIEILKGLDYLSEKREKQCRQQMVERNLINGHVPDITEDIPVHSMKRLHYIIKFRKLFYCMLDWNRLKSEGKSIERFLQTNGYYSIAIHGIGEVGELIYEELKDSSIEIKYAIDRSALDFEGQLSIMKMEDELPKVDLIISTVFGDTKDILEQLKSRSKSSVLRLDQIMDALKDMGGTI